MSNPTGPATTTDADAALINEVLTTHQINTTSKTRGSIVQRHAGCTCDPAIEFDWYERDNQHKAHVYAEIFKAGRASAQTA